jgi:uncharacterized membrane protein
MASSGLGRPAALFVWLAVPFGLAFAVATPPLQAPDEWGHLMMAYRLSRGELWPEPYPGPGQEGIAAVRVPASLPGMVGRLDSDRLFFHPEQKQDVRRVLLEFGRPLEPDRRVWEPLPMSYGPVTYLPAALAAGFAGLLDASPITYLYLGRLANLLAFVLLGTIALRAAPAHQWLLLVLASTPMTLAQASVLTADTVTNGLFYVLFALVLRACTRSGPVGWRELGVLAALCALLGLCKQGYAPLFALVFLVPGRRFSSPTRRFVSEGLVAAAGLLTFAAWSWSITRLPRLVPPGADPPERLANVLAHPFDYARLLVTTLAEQGGLYLQSFIGIFGHVDTFLPAWLYAIWSLVLLAVALSDGGARSPIQGAGRAWLLAISAATFLVVVTALYGETPVGSPVILGVQGRYFVPIAPLALASLHVRSAPLRREQAGFVLTALCALALGVSLFTLVERYYGIGS